MRAFVIQEIVSFFSDIDNFLGRFQKDKPDAVSKNTHLLFQEGFGSRVFCPDVHVFLI